MSTEAAPAGERSYGVPPSATSHLASEVLSQPDVWRKVVGRRPELGPLLPAKGARVAVALGATVSPPDEGTVRQAGRG